MSTWKRSQGSNYENTRLQTTHHISRNIIACNQIKITFFTHQGMQRHTLRFIAMRTLRLFATPASHMQHPHHHRHIHRLKVISIMFTTLYKLHNSCALLRSVQPGGVREYNELSLSHIHSRRTCCRRLMRPAHTEGRVQYPLNSHTPAAHWHRNKSPRAANAARVRIDGRSSVSQHFCRRYAYHKAMHGERKAMLHEAESAHIYFYCMPLEYIFSAYNTHSIVYDCVGCIANYAGFFKIVFARLSKLFSALWQLQITIFFTVKLRMFKTSEMF